MLQHCDLIALKTTSVTAFCIAKMYNKKQIPASFIKWIFQQTDVHIWGFNLWDGRKLLLGEKMITYTKSELTIYRFMVTNKRRK